MFIHLPVLAAIHIQRREPTVEAATGVEALQVAEIQDFGLWRVADDGDLAGAVLRRWNIIPQRQPWMSPMAMVRGIASPVLRRPGVVHGE